MKACTNTNAPLYEKTEVKLEKDLNSHPYSWLVKSLLFKIRVLQEQAMLVLHIHTSFLFATQWLLCHLSNGANPESYSQSCDTEYHTTFSFTSSCRSGWMTLVNKACWSYPQNSPAYWFLWQVPSSLWRGHSAKKRYKRQWNVFL